MLAQFSRTVSILAEHVRALYKRQLVNSYVTGLRDGAYWGIGTHLSDYQVDTPLGFAPERVTELAQLPVSLVSCARASARTS